MKRASASATVWMASPAAKAGPQKAKVTTVNEEILRHIEWVFGGLCLGLLLLAGFQAWLRHVSLPSLGVISAFSIINLAIYHWIRRRPETQSPLIFHTALGMLLCPAAYLLVDGALQPWWPAYAVMAASGAVIWTLQSSAKWGCACLALYMVNMLLTARLGLSDPTWTVIMVQIAVLGAIGLLLVEMTDILSQSLSKVYERSLFHRKGKEEFQELARLKTDFFANVSHEFRTPITLTLGPLEAILRGRHGEIGPEPRRQLEVAVRNQQRLLSLINQILDSAKIEAKAIELKAARQPDVNRLIQEWVEPFRSLADTRGLIIRTSLDPLAQGMEIYFDREKVEKILFNLLSNAMKFTKQGFIEVGTEVRADRFVMRVADSGMGIRAEELPHVFERYRQAKGSSQSEFAGTGLGLNLVREFTRLHGGEVSVESVYGQGTRFELWVPLGRAHLTPEQIVEAGEGDSFAPAPAPGEKNEAAGGISCAELNAEVELNRDTSLPTVVCAEDNPDLRYFLRDLLRDKHNVFVGANGEEGLALAEKWRPDLILSDVSMPKIDGMEFCRRIRENSDLKSTPFVLLTARTMTESRLEGLGHGADDYLTKPFSEAELLARVHNLIALRRHQVRLQRELAAARAIQFALLPAGPQRFDGATLDFLYHPSEELSGDFCDIVLREDWIYFYVADVTSHGTASAQVTYLLKEIVSDLVERGTEAPPLPELLQELQRRYASRQLDYDVAIQIGRYHPGQRLLQAARGGAPSPLQVNRDLGTKVLMIRPSASLSGRGAAEASSISIGELSLAPGDAVYFFTDGCYEFPAGSRDYGAKNLHQALSQAHATKDWKQSLLDSLATAHGSKNFPDDVTCLRVMPEDLSS
ncbi:MAG TPA: ATP-binding protein [bacterium]|nr:ATP-binding protein [bacterium]